MPARWAWHDHSPASRRAHGAAYATYVGSYRSRFRITQGAEEITRFTDPDAGAVRSFCARCGTPLTYERPRGADDGQHRRALFDSRTGREPRYHIAIEEFREWAYTGAPLRRAEGLSAGVVWERPRRRKRPAHGS